MCITFFYISADSSSQIKFFVAFNREENVRRPTQPLDEFSEDPNILGGRDLKQKGTWLGFNKKTYNIAFLTNYFIPTFIRDSAINYKSRGNIIGDFLKSDFYKQGFENKAEIIDYLNKIKTDKMFYPPFNLVLGNIKLMKFYYFGNYHRYEDFLIIGSGLHSMCNFNLFFENENQREKSGVKCLEKILATGKKDCVDEISNVMMGNVKEKTKVFKNFPFLTTLTTSVIIIDQENKGVFQEITYVYRFPMLARIFALGFIDYKKKTKQIKQEEKLLKEKN